MILDYGQKGTSVDAENPVRPLDTCISETYSLILFADFANPDFVTLLPVYGSLPFSPYPCTLILCASCGTDVRTLISPDPSNLERKAVSFGEMSGFLL